MRLAERLLVGSVAIVSLFVLAVVVIAGGRLQSRLRTDQHDELLRDARLVATQWRTEVDADALADTSARVLGYRVTLLATDGRVVGDSELDGEGLARAASLIDRPEIRSAARHGASRPIDTPADESGGAIAAVVQHPALGFVRVSVSPERFQGIVRGAQRDVAVSSLLALAGAVVLAWIFSRSVSRPVTELRDVARAIAAGNLAARPSLAATGEVGDLAIALHRMTEELSRRLNALREEDALLTALVESLNEGVLAITERGDVARINQSGRTLLRITAAVPFPAEVLPRNPAFREAIESALAGDVVEPEELQVGGRTLAVTARPLAVGGAVVTLFDLTPMRRLETVRQDFAANVSHELKTPLTVVHGFAETLALDPDLPSSQRQHFARAILASAARMQRIVDDLLDLSRIESGSWVPNPAWVDAPGLIRDVFTTVESAAEAKGVRLVSEVEDAERFYADPTAMRQVLCNLVENAVRHTPSGSVTVSASRQDGGVSVRVRDTGVGIAAEHLPRIFERFYRVDPSRSRNEGGTGLGLAIVKHLVDAHGGRVSASSDPGKGTTVAVFLPDGAAPEIGTD